MKKLSLRPERKRAHRKPAPRPIKESHPKILEAVAGLTWGFSLKGWRARGKDELRTLSSNIREGEHDFQTAWNSDKGRPFARKVLNSTNGRGLDWKKSVYPPWWEPKETRDQGGNH